MIAFGWAVLIVIIAISLATMVGVMVLGSKENVSGHGFSASESHAAEAWAKRAESAEASRSAKTSDAG